MKKMRRLIPAIAMLLVSAVMLSTASFAWFTISTEATATGMTVQAKAGSSLLIVTEDDRALWLQASGVVDFEDEETPKILTPATHDNAYLADNGSGLKTLSNDAAADVISATGAYDGTDYVAATPGTHYYDYVVFLGTAGAEMTAKYLNAQVTITNTLTYSLHNAMSVDFLVNGTYAGTINLEQVNDNSKKYDIDIAQNLTIPQAVLVGDDGSITDGSCVKITMRVYFDGALKEDATNYYVRNAMASTANIGFTVNFAATETASEGESVYDLPTT